MTTALHRIGSKIGFDDLRQRAHLRWGTVSDDFPLAEHDNAICKIAHHLHVVLDPKHGELQLVADAQQKTGEEQVSLFKRALENYAAVFYDEDGKPDIVAANWGSNTPWQLYRAKQLRL